MSYRYKVVETQIVTDDSLEGILNDGLAEGWTLEGIQFAMSDASRRPAMAFVLFIREDSVSGGESSNGQ
ncbi:DUF4177 domain-containing protein [bacterium]|nr:MAG: DUF4177 domain-containing protein [bacterium]